MKKRKWLNGILLTSLILLGVSACGTKSNTQKNSDGKEQKTVGVLQLVEHGSLDAAYEGFLEGLKEEGFVEGENLVVNYQNAQNNQDNLKSMSEKLVKEKPDLLLGIATQAGQSLLSETTEIPILVTAVTDLVEAKLVKSNEKPGGNVSGTTDMVPIDQQAKLLLSIVPDAKVIGIAYNASESNSKVQAELAKKAFEKEGVKVEELTASTTNDVQQVITSLAKKCDGLYIPTDNTFANASELVGEIAKEQKIPVVAGSVEQVEKGALATFGLDYGSLGKQTGKMAAKILKGEATPADMPVESAENLKLVVNEDMAKALDIDPESIKTPE